MEFVERDLGVNSFSDGDHPIISAGDTFEAERRQINKDRVENEQSLPPASKKLPRRTRGKGRRIRPHPKI